MKKLITVSFLLISGFIFSQEIWTLNKCLDYARKNNINIRLAENEVQSSAIDYRNSLERMLPSLNIGSSASWNYGLTQNLTTGVLENQTVFGNSIRLSSDLPVFQGFFLRLNRQSAYLSKLLAEYNLQNQIKTTEINIVNAYLQILMNHEALKAMEAQWKSGLEQIRKMRELVNAGVRPESDLKDLEAQSANDYYNVIRLQNAYKISKINLAQLLELDDINHFEIDTNLSAVSTDESLLIKNPEDLFRNHLENIPEYRQVETGKKWADKQLALAKSAYYPSVSFFVSWNSRYMDREKITGFQLDQTNPYRIIGITENTHENVLAPNFKPILGPPDPYFTQINNNQGTAFGFSINFPVFNRFQTRRRVQKARIEQKKAALRMDLQKIEIRNRIYKLHADVINAKQKTEAARKNLEASETAFKYALEKLNAGLISSYELENIRNRKIKAQTDYISSKFEYLLKLKLLEISLKSYDNP